MANLIAVRWASFGSYRDPGTGDWLPKVVTANAVRIEAEFGDGMYSVSEIQLFGERAGG